MEDLPERAVNPNIEHVLRKHRDVRRVKTRSLRPDDEIDLRVAAAHS
jgi:hypothetical protein